MFSKFDSVPAAIVQLMTALARKEKRRMAGWVRGLGPASAVIL
jgi:hypothetical protein